MKQYIVITSHNLGDLSSSVESYLNEGWQISGSVFINGWVKKTFYQPMIKEDPQPIYRDIGPTVFKSRSKN